MATNKLSVKQVKSAVGRAKPYRLSDGGGMYLEVTPRGGKWWRLKYRFEGREQLISLGTFPDVDLERARSLRSENRTLLAKGINPSAHRKAAKVSNAENGANTFEILAREWHRTMRAGWVDAHADRVLARLEKHIFPSLGKMPISNISAPSLLASLRLIESTGAVETAHRVLQICGRVFRFAVATGRADADPTTALRGALKPVIVQHHAAITNRSDLGALLRAIDGYSGQALTRMGLQLAPLLFVRPGELRAAEWAEIDFERRTWTIPSRRVKASSQDHVVPLARQAVSILRDAETLSGDGRFVFPGDRSRKRPISDMTLPAALRRLGYSSEQATVHGFRATARTLLDEVLGFRPDFIEHQLAHAVRDPNGRAYNRTAFLIERAEMMQRWADFLDECKEETVAVTEKKPSNDQI